MASGAKKKSSQVWLMQSVLGVQPANLTKNEERDAVLPETFWGQLHLFLHFPTNADSEESACQGRRLEFNPWVRKIPWSRKWQPTPVFLPGKSHGQRNLVGYSPWGHKDLDMTDHAHTHTYTHTYSDFYDC